MLVLTLMDINGLCLAIHPARFDRYQNLLCSTFFSYLFIWRSDSFGFRSGNNWLWSGTIFELLEDSLILGPNHHLYQPRLGGYAIWVQLRTTDRSDMVGPLFELVRHGIFIKSWSHLEYRSVSLFGIRDHSIQLTGQAWKLADQYGTLVNASLALALYPV
jgi:hypothetical protein